MNEHLRHLRPVEFLLVEDNPGDIRLTQESLNESRILNNLSIVKDGVQAMAFLHNEAPYQDAVRPDVILLDLNLPRMSGHEVLHELKADPDLQSIPIVILTASSAEDDVIKSYREHANCFITKPLDYNQFMKVVQTINDFWLSIVTLPSDTTRIVRS